MSEADDRAEVSQTITYEGIEPTTVFRIAWYVIASKPGVILKEYNETESRMFEANARFQIDIEGIKSEAQVVVEEEPPSIALTIRNDDETALSSYASNLADEIKSSIEKFGHLKDDVRQRVTRALIAKGCWDRLVFHILGKSPASEVYFQLAHGREMMIKATEGEEISQTSLTTSGWLSKIESLPKDETLPVEIATEIAKKSVEWKKETVAFIQRFL